MEQGQVKKKDSGGYLYRNADKRSAKSPDWRGKVTWKGEELLISGWNDPSRGDMISISLTDPATLPPRPDSGAPRQAAAPAATGPQGAFAPGGQRPQQAPSPAPSQSSGGGVDDAFDDLDDLEKLFKS